MAAYGGIDLGGTKIQTAVLDQDHSVLGSARRPTPTSGGPADVARAVAYLLSDSADMIHGVTMPIDGGFLAV